MFYYMHEYYETKNNFGNIKIFIRLCLFLQNNRSFIITSFKSDKDNVLH